MSDYWKDFWNKNEITDKKGVHEKVGRTIKGVAIDERKWKKTLDDLELSIELNSTDDVLDIAAGSGAIAIPFCEKVRSYTALDISEKLLNGLRSNSKIKTIQTDARYTDLGEEKYSKVILYFALQHFNEKESVELFEKIYKCLKPNGICYIGDIPDVERKFSFFNTPEREKAYFDSLKNNQPIIGTWFDKKFIEKAGSLSGFEHCVIIDQPAHHINAHYRFDIKLVKK
jgi:ubiquinone/menaquinone biosynthesis C-methylase UbiE